jgi:hypothetical protein
MIADIDKLLAHKGKRLWGVVSSQEEPRQVLGRIRDFLVQETDEKETDSQAQLPPLVAKFVGEGNQDFVESQKPQSPDHQLSELIAPLKAELKMLFEERANLVSEIRDLEKKRLHDYSLAQQLASQEKIISEFMQVLTNRLSDDIYAGIKTASVGDQTPDITQKKALSASGNKVDSARVERLTQLTNDLDQRLVALDGTVNVVFEALQRNIHAYNDSLSEALARMHYKGVQGEQLLEAFIKNFANLPPSQAYRDSLKQTTDEIILETIDYSSIQSSTQLDEDINDFENVDSVEASKQDNNEKLSVTPDETIDNIEFSQDQDEDEDDTSITSDLSAVISQLEEETNTEEQLNQELTQELTEESEQDNYLEIEFPEEETVEQEIEPEIEPEIIKESDAFDSPEKMQAVLSELKKSAVETEELAASPSKGTANEDEVDELYASLLDSDNLTTSNPPTPQSQVVTPAINAEIPDTSDLNSQLEETQTEKEVVSQEVVFEYTPPSSTTQTVNNSSELPVEDPWVNPSNTDLAALSESTKTNTFLSSVAKSNQTTSYSYKRKRQAASEDTIAELTELLFTEETSPEVSTQTTQNSESQLDLAASTEQEIATPIEQPEVNTQTATTPEIKPEIKQPLPEEEIITSEKPQLKEITLPVTSLTQLNPSQPDSNREASHKETPLPQTENTINTSQEENSTNSNYAGGASTEIPSINNSDTVWYLGIDIGTTGISATLLNRSTYEIHPIYWWQENQPQTTSQNWNFRLPAEVYLPKNSPRSDTGEDGAEQNIFSAYLKPYLQISLPYKNHDESTSTQVRPKWEPILQLNEFSTVPLVWIVRSLSKLLLTLKSDSNSTTLGLTATAIGISPEQFSHIINHIAGVICTCPSSCEEQYRFNIRESLLLTKLVKHPQQVFFVEEAIASLIGSLEGANGEIVKLITSENRETVVTSDSQLIGNTITINIGATATEMALVDIPENLQDLTHNEFMLHGFNCGGKAMEQDIITQLLLPTKWRKSRNTQSNDSANDNNPLHWKPNIPGLEQVRFSSLGLEQLELPRAGEPDLSQRISLQQRLESSPLGKALLDAAIALKLILQHQESFTIELADQRWELQRRDLESQVFVPFVRRINRELNKLLVARGIPTEAINQIILSGGVSSISAISRWLRQKLPSAKIIQEKYLGENGTPACSRVAIGLSVLPLHPLVLDIPRQQYTDYFLFTELLRLIPEKALSFGEVIQLFEARGINTRTCQQRLLAFLEGEIPPGLVPNKQDMQWLSQSSVENNNYKAIVASPLFDKQGSLSYRANLQQLECLRKYLDTIKASAHQSLEEPYTVNFAVGVSE